MKLLLTDGGVGDLVLGSSPQKAKATGLVGRKEASGACTMYQGRGGVARIWMYKGKVIITDVHTAIRTDSGIGVGDTFAQVHKVYPDATIDETSLQMGIDAPKAPFAAHYRVVFDGMSPDSKVIELGLQWSDQPCYE